MLWLIVDIFLSSPETGKGRKNLKRPNPFVGEGVEGSSSRLASSEGNGYRASLPITRSARPPPYDHAVPKAAEAEAEAFLQDMSDSFRPHKVLKTEPVDDVLPPQVLLLSSRTVRFTPPIS